MENDQEYSDYVISRVKSEDGGYEVSFEPSNLSLWVIDKGITPKVGNSLRIYGLGVGFPVRGIVIDGQLVRYETKEAMQHRYEQEAQAREQQQRERFETTERSVLDAQYESLPPCFQQRIDKFRENNPDFRWKYESYEMFVCTQAVAFAHALKTPEALQAWYELDYEEQRQQVPAMDDGHSGNTFGMSAVLAFDYLSHQEDKIIQRHGALAPLVGSEEYGCVPRS